MKKYYRIQTTSPFVILFVAVEESYLELSYKTIFPQSAMQVAVKWSSAEPRYKWSRLKQSEEQLPTLC